MGRCRNCGAFEPDFESLKDQCAHCGYAVNPEPVRDDPVACNECGDDSDPHSLDYCERCGKPHCATCLQRVGTRRACMACVRIENQRKQTQDAVKRVAVVGGTAVVAGAAIHKGLEAWKR
jgi:ribosomal protein L37E